MLGVLSRLIPHRRATLKPSLKCLMLSAVASHPAQAGYVEASHYESASTAQEESHPAQAGYVEATNGTVQRRAKVSHPAQAGYVEAFHEMQRRATDQVSSRTGGLR